ncbi:hypothetical protein [Chryseobacterium sp. A301]
MKILLSLSFVFLSLLLGAQNLADYKYVYVPVKFNDFKTNNAYNLNKILQSKLEDKNYSTSQEEPSILASQIGNDLCQVVSAELVDTSNMFRNKVSLVFKDCKGRVVSSFKAESRIKEFHKGFQDALLQAIAQVPVSTGSGVNIKASSPAMKEVVKETPKQVIVEQKQVASAPAKAQETTSTEVVETIQTKVEASSGFQVFTWKGVDYTKVNLGAGHFILTQPKNTAPFADFKESAKTGIYHVTLGDASTAIGYSEGENFVIEMRDSKGNFTKEVFVGK